MDWPVLALSTVPLLSFVLSGALEFQRDRRSLRSLARALPVAVGGIAAIVFLTDIYSPYVSLTLSKSKTMSALSLLVALSALLCRYRSRLAATLIFCGGVVLAILWLLNRWVA